MDLDGREIGILHNIVVDGATGLLSELVVKPAAELDTSGFKEGDAYIFIPFQAVKAMKDVIIVDREEVQDIGTGVTGFEPVICSLGGCRHVLTRPHALDRCQVSVFRFAVIDSSGHT